MEGKIDLKKFCENVNAGFEYFKYPFSIGKYSYATNRHICVRVPFNGANKLDIPRPEIESAFSKIDLSEIDFIDFGKIKFEPKVSAVDCSCSGHDCPTCECIYRCEYCDGDGILRLMERDSVDIFGTWFDSYYIYLIQTLPGIKLSKTKDNMMYFVFDGGDGIIMKCIEGGMIRTVCDEATFKTFQ